MALSRFKAEIKLLKREINFYLFIYFPSKYRTVLLDTSRIPPMKSLVS